jgi:hypothetical protein
MVFAITVDVLVSIFAEVVEVISNESRGHLISAILVQRLRGMDYSSLDVCTIVFIVSHGALQGSHPAIY